MRASLKEANIKLAEKMARFDRVADVTIRVGECEPSWSITDRAIVTMIDNDLERLKLDVHMVPSDCSIHSSCNTNDYDAEMG